MGMRFYSYVFYGFEVKNNTDEFYDLMEETWQNDSKVIIDIIGDGEYYFIAVKESLIQASEYDDGASFVQLVNTDKAGWDFLLYQFCDEHNILYTQPTWVFAGGFR